MDKQKTKTQTNANTKCFKDSMYTIFPKDFKDFKYVLHMTSGDDKHKEFF